MARPMHDLALRSAVGLTGSALILGIVFAPPAFALALLALILATSLAESLSLGRHFGDRAAAGGLGILLFCAISLVLCPYLWERRAPLLALFLLPAFAGLRAKPLLPWTYPLLVASGVIAAMLLRIEHGPGSLMTVLAITWAADIGAYLVGMRFGKRPLAPTISPAKTIEGAFGGLAATLLAGWFCGFLADRVLAGILIGAAAGIFGQAGDLVESRLKRLAGVKDSGSIIPGHGGVLDRFDAFLVNAPLGLLVAYYLW